MGEHGGNLREAGRPGRRLAKSGWFDGESPFGGSATGPNPTDRGKKGRKRSLLTDGSGIPLGLAIEGANVQDKKLVERTFDDPTVPRPDPATVGAHLCVDKGYDRGSTEEQSIARGFTPHMRRIGEEKLERSTGTTMHPARRWVVERTGSWLNGFRKLLVSFEKKEETALALLHFACAYITLRRAFAPNGGS